MKTVYWFIGIIILIALGYYAFSVGWILLKAFIGLMFIFIFALGFWLGTISVKREEKKDMSNTRNYFN